DVPGADRVLPAQAPRGGVRLARARPRAARAAVADPPRRPDHRAADGDPRRERPARAGARGRADRGGAAGARPRRRLPPVRGRGTRPGATREPDRRLPAGGRVPRADAARLTRRPDSLRRSRTPPARPARGGVTGRAWRGWGGEEELGERGGRVR